MPRKEPPISREELFKQIGYTPHSDEQWQFHHSGARFRVPCCGRRWGKSTAAARELLYASFIPDTYYWIVGPSYSLGEKEFRILRHDMVHKLKLNKHPKFRVSNNVKQGDMRIELPWNTIIEVKSADRPDTLVGEGLDGLIMSEAALHSRATWELQLQPALSDKRGWCIFPSTPRGYNWYQGLYMLGQEDESHELYESWRFPSWTNVAMYPSGRDDDEIRRIESEVSRTFFRQEIAAEFTAFEGQIYEDWAYEHHVGDLKYNPNWRSFQTFDFGFSDPFVCLDIQVDAEENVYVWREYQVSGMTTWEHCDVLLNRENPAGFHNDGRFADPRGADGIATLELRIGPIQSPVVPWVQGIEAVRRWLKVQPTGKPKLFVDRSCVQLIRQMEQLRHAEVKEGKNARIGQHDYDDHGPDALRYFFGPYFVVGVAGSLSDVYSSPATEAQTFFQLHRGFQQSAH